MFANFCFKHLANLANICQYPHHVILSYIVISFCNLSLVILCHCHLFSSSCYLAILSACGLVSLIRHYTNLLMQVYCAAICTFKREKSRQCPDKTFVIWKKCISRDQCIWQNSVWVLGYCFDILITTVDWQGPPPPRSDIVRFYCLFWESSASNSFGRPFGRTDSMEHN